MTPAGLAFFQCRWDDSVTHTFHQLLGKGGGLEAGAAGLSSQTSPVLTGSSLGPQGVSRPLLGWIGWAVPAWRQGRRAQASNCPHDTPSLLLQKCGSPCLNLCGHLLTTPSKSASPTGSLCGTWTGTETVTNPPMASTEWPECHSLCQGPQLQGPELWGARPCLRQPRRGLPAVPGVAAGISV